MAKELLRRKSSIPSYLQRGETAVEIEEKDLRWRRSSQAAISAMLPSHGAFHSDTGLVLSRALTDPQRRKSIINRRKSFATLSGPAAADLPSSPSACRELLKGMGGLGQMLVGEETEHHTLHSIKSMTATISVKRKYRDQLITQPQSTLKGPSLWKYQLAMALLQTSGHFGTATLSYFRFLRWLMFLNLFMSIIILCVTFVPFLILKPKEHSDFASSVNGCLSEFYYKAQYFSRNYSDSVASSWDEESKFQTALDILQGTGWLENTELFYGIYHNRTYNFQLIGHHVYNMSLAYLFAVGAVFLLCFLLLVKNSAKGLKNSLQTSSGGMMTMYCNKLFGAWDYCISQEKTAKLKHKNILQDLNNDLEYQRLQWKKEGRTAKQKAKLYIVRLLVNVLVIAILAASLYLIYYTNEQLIKLQNDKSKSDMVLLLLQYLPSITITILNVIVPLLFNKVVIAEDYMPMYQMRMTLTRTVLLRLASLGVLMLSLYNALAKHKPKVNIDILCDNLNPTPNITTAPLVTATTETSSLEPPKTSAAIINVDDIQCWETYVGQQIYKLVILNFLVVVLVTLVWEFPRKLIYSKFRTKVKLVSLLGQQEFDVSKSVLDLIYLQTLCWLGIFFCPFISAMCLVKCFIFFYIKKASLLTNCLPMQQYGTSKSNSLFMMVLLLSFGLSAVPIAYMISSIQPSQGCGPFRVYSYAEYVMFDSISNLVASWPSDIRKILHFMGTGGFMAIATLLLCLLMYYFWAVGQGNRKMAKILREQLKMEGQDKQFLLARVNEVLSWEEVAEQTDTTIDSDVTANADQLRR